MDRNSVVLKSGRFSLYSEDQSVGDSGPAFECLDPETLEIVGVAGEIRVGHLAKCGSIFARSYQSQDWWRTSPVLEILSVNEDSTEVKFRTRSRTYVAKSF
jgi:hypothetical protein